MDEPTEPGEGAPEAAPAPPGPPEGAPEPPDTPEPPEAVARVPHPRAARGLDIYPTFLHGLATGIRALPAGALVLLPTVLVVQAASVFGAPALMTGRLQPGDWSAVPAAEWVVLAGILVFQLTLGTWAQAALFTVCDATLRGEGHVGFARAYATSLERVPSLLGSALLFFAAVAVGLVLCILPGIWIATVLAYALPRSVLRGEGPGAALRSSYELARGRFWRLFGAQLLLVFVIDAVTLPLVMGISLRPEGPAPAPLFAAAVLIGLFSPVFIASVLLALHEKLEAKGPLPR